MDTQLPKRKERADVVRNRVKLLEVAQEHFLAHGVATSLDAVAKEAGVGPATLYRHFPTRDALLAGLLEMRRGELVEQQGRIDSIVDVEVALREWLQALEDYFSLYSGLPQPLLSTIKEGDAESSLGRSCNDLIAVTKRYLDDAQRNGRIREDVEALDLFMTANMLAWLRTTGAADPAALTRLRRTWEVGCRTSPRRIVAGAEP